MEKSHGKQMNITFKNSELNSLKTYRIQYLNQLPAPQEQFLELQLLEATYHFIQIEKEIIGYIIHNETLLLEFFLLSHHNNQSSEIFEQCLSEFKISEAYVKSFDHPLMDCSLLHASKYELAGVLFKKRDPDFYQSPFWEGEVRNAAPQDFPIIQSINEEVFEKDQEIHDFIQAGKIKLFYLQQKLVGFGIISRTVPELPEHDVGMLVCEPFRNKGFGVKILSYMADYCFQQGWIPTGGCAADNIASQKSLIKSGFISTEKMWRFEF
jgi:GNAT superfamily N-acetyltransferase